MAPQFQKLRRKDRAVEDLAWIEDLLNRAPVGTLALISNGQPFLHLAQFTYDPLRQAVYFHGARQGRTFEALQTNAQVCFSVFEQGRLLPARQAMEFGTEFASVMAFGQVELVSDPEEARQSLQHLLDKYFPHLHPGEDYTGVEAREVAHTAVYRLEIESWSGKRKQAPDNFPGAFDYPYPGPRDG